jgi:hypothetical protein
LRAMTNPVIGGQVSPDLVAVDLRRIAQKILMRCDWYDSFRHKKTPSWYPMEADAVVALWATFPDPGYHLAQLQVGGASALSQCRVEYLWVEGDCQFIIFSLQVAHNWPDSSQPRYTIMGGIQNMAIAPEHTEASCIINNSTAKHWIIPVVTLHCPDKTLLAG